MIAYRRIKVFSLNELRSELSKSICGYSGHKHNFFLSDKLRFFFPHHTPRSNVKSSNNYFLTGGKGNIEGH